VSSIGKGSNIQFKAVGLYSDGSKHDVTLLANWSSSDADIATLDSVEKGYVHSIKESTAAGVDIVATLEGISGKANLVVTTATPIGLVITPIDENVSLGGGVFFTGTLSFSDGSTEDVSYESFWTSSDSNILSFPGDGSHNGQYHGTSRGVGVATITATYTDSTGRVFVDTTTFTITDALIDSVDVTPDSNTQVTGQEYQLNAIGGLSDNSSSDITATTNWTSSHPDVASVNAYGLVHSLKAGVTIITASEKPYSDSTAWTVIDAGNISSFTVSCRSITVAVGREMQCSATGSDGSGATVDITSQVDWSSSDTAIAVVDDYYENSGKVTGVTVGNTIISGTFRNMSGGNSVLINVTP
jgi:hypothetical protein